MSDSNFDNGAAESDAMGESELFDFQIVWFYATSEFDRQFYSVCVTKIYTVLVSVQSFSELFFFAWSPHPVHPSHFPSLSWPPTPRHCAPQPFLWSCSTGLGNLPPGTIFIRLPSHKHEEDLWPLAIPVFTWSYLLLLSLSLSFFHSFLGVCSSFLSFLFLSRSSSSLFTIYSLMSLYLYISSPLQINLFHCHSYLSLFPHSIVVLFTSFASIVFLCFFLPPSSLSSSAAFLRSFLYVAFLRESDYLGDDLVKITI